MKANFGSTLAVYFSAFMFFYLPYLAINKICRIYLRLSIHEFVNMVRCAETTSSPGDDGRVMAEVLQGLEDSGYRVAHRVIAPWLWWSGDVICASSAPFIVKCCHWYRIGQGFFIHSATEAPESLLCALENRFYSLEVGGWHCLDHPTNNNLNQNHSCNPQLQTY
jgi:hypothetical protein